MVQLKEASDDNRRGGAPATWPAESINSPYYYYIMAMLMHWVKYSVPVRRIDRVRYPRLRQQQTQRENGDCSFHHR